MDCPDGIFTNATHLTAVVTFLKQKAKKNPLVRISVKFLIPFQLTFSNSAVLEGAVSVNSVISRTCLNTLYTLLLSQTGKPTISGTPPYHTYISYKVRGFYR